MKEIDMEKMVKLEEKPCPISGKKSNNMQLKLVVRLVMSILYLSTISNAEVPSLQDVLPEKEKCDLFSGKWIPNISASSYTNTSCKFLSDYWNCMKNGRPDEGYLYWRWKPHNCDLLTFNPNKFLNAMRDKSLAIVGDSLARNQLQSLLCLLSEADKSIRTYHGKGYKYMRWHFRSYNFTLANYWAPFLLQAEFLSKRKVNLHLDALDNEWTANYHKHDCILLASSPWFSTPTIIMENDTIVGCHSCNGQFKEFGSFYLYQRALQMAFNFTITSDHKPLVIFRTWSGEHINYRKGFKGGFCDRTTPYDEGEHEDTPTGHKNYAIDMEEFKRAVAIGSENGTRLKLLDIYHLSLLRPDGHPGPYMHFHPFDKDKHAQVENDCVHWCLPGPIDIWNDLLMEMVLKEGNTSLKDIS